LSVSVGVGTQKRVRLKEFHSRELLHGGEKQDARTTELRATYAHANAVAAFPGEPIVAVRLDIASAYNRIGVRPRDVPLGALLFEGSDGETYVAMPIVEWFGSQDSNFHFQMIAEDLASLAAHRSIRDTGAMLSGTYTDDYFVFGTRGVCPASVRQFHCGCGVPFGRQRSEGKRRYADRTSTSLADANDTTPAHTIGLSLSLYMKMVCAVYVMVAMNVQPGA
jgi:hypothetical protein